MYREFKDFLLKQNALALAVGVITGAAMGRVVTSLVSDMLMPLISLGMPGGDWRASKIVLSRAVGPDGKEVINSVNYGAFAGTIIDFVCMEAVPAAAKKCRACASAL
jgi:large conductance mechanosensitive channel